MNEEKQDLAERIWSAAVSVWYGCSCGRNADCPQAVAEVRRVLAEDQERRSDETESSTQSDYLTCRRGCKCRCHNEGSDCAHCSVSRSDLIAMRKHWHSDRSRADERDAEKQRSGEMAAALLRREEDFQAMKDAAERAQQTARECLDQRDRRDAALSQQLEADRTKVAECMTAALKAIDSRHWLTEGRGSYEWNDDRWHQEFYAAAVEIRAALAPLAKIAADWTGCPKTGAEVARARMDQDEALRGLLAIAEEVTEWLPENTKAALRAEISKCREVLG